MSNCDLAAQKHGRVVLFIGNECLHWQPSDFGNAARFARSLGVDTIAPKRFNGNQKWYVNPAHLKEEREAALAVGCGYLPFGYCYGPSFGDEQIAIEAATALEVMSVNDGMVCLDMESEWNGRAADAEKLASHLANHGGILTISTWADPIQQNWTGVLKALLPVATVFGPQEYTDWLGAQEQQLVNLGATCIQPAFDLSPSFGPDHLVTLVQAAKDRGDKTIWLWEYQYAQQNPALVHELVSIFGGSSPVPAPPPPPTGWQTYTVQHGDTLSGIAEYLHLANWFTDLYQPNQAEIEAAARAHGQPNSESGHWIYPGTVLKYRR
jgi:LysM repeat protein